MKLYTKFRSQYLKAHFSFEGFEFAIDALFDHSEELMFSYQTLMRRKEGAQHAL